MYVGRYTSSLLISQLVIAKLGIWSSAVLGAFGDQPLISWGKGYKGKGHSGGLAHSVGAVQTLIMIRHLEPG